MNEIITNENITTNILQLVSFKIDSEEFGVDILKVQEINRIMEITQIPNTPDYVEGVVNLRGRIIPIVDLRTRLNFEKREHDSNTRIIVVELVARTVGFIVDEVSEVLRLPKNIIEAPPAMVSGINSEYITAIGKLEDRLLILLELEKVLTTEEMKELEAV